MTTIELKSSLLDSIKDINDAEVIRKISRYVKKAIIDSQKNKITKADLIISPEALAIVNGLKGGKAIDDKNEYRKHLEEKYK